MFFTRREKLAGTALFFFGILLIVVRWPMIGMIFESLGIANLFGLVFLTKQTPIATMSMSRSMSRSAPPAESTTTVRFRPGIDFDKAKAAISLLSSFSRLKELFIKLDSRNNP